MSSQNKPPPESASVPSSRSAIADRVGSAIEPTTLSAPAPTTAKVTNKCSLRIELFIQDHDAFVDFYTRVLRFRVSRDKRPESMYVAVQRDAVRIAGGLAEHPVPREARAIPNGTEIVLEVDDLDAELAQVVSSGWPLADDKQLRPWGLVDFRMYDPDGYYIRVTNRE